MNPVVSRRGSASRHPNHNRHRNLNPLRSAITIKKKIKITTSPLAPNQNANPLDNQGCEDYKPKSQPD